MNMDWILEREKLKQLSDQGLRHKLNVKPEDYLRSFLQVGRYFAFATHDDSWGEFEKELHIMALNLFDAKVQLRKLERIREIEKGHCERNHAFCPDCRDKLPINTCFRCQQQSEVRKLTERLDQAVEALMWCGGSMDFSPEGKARDGWERICKPVIDLWCLEQKKKG